MVNAVNDSLSLPVNVGYRRSAVQCREGSIERGWAGRYLGTEYLEEYDAPKLYRQEEVDRYPAHHPLWDEGDAALCSPPARATGGRPHL